VTEKKKKKTRQKERIIIISQRKQNPSAKGMYRTNASGIDFSTDIRSAPLTVEEAVEIAVERGGQGISRSGGGGGFGGFLS
jgi:hypothetical protein